MIPVPLGPLGPLGPLVLLVLPPATAMAANQQPGEIKGRKKLLFRLIGDHQALNVFISQHSCHPILEHTLVNSFHARVCISNREEILFGAENGLHFHSCPW